mmetsp:Transcript_10824/g.17110  ORF Transcript_10824/g.17110 Transcript_10824/m.17110 type:complete len:146 (-) Transcript_10824:130-567(-)
MSRIQERGMLDWVGVFLGDFRFFRHFLGGGVREGYSCVGCWSSPHSNHPPLFCPRRHVETPRRLPSEPRPGIWPVIPGEDYVAGFGLLVGERGSERGIKMEEGKYLAGREFWEHSISVEKRRRVKSLSPGFWYSVIKKSGESRVV